MFCFSAIFCAIFAATTGQFLNCPWVNTLNCQRYPTENLCATDHLTYDNKCDFAKEQCKKPNLHILATSTCASLNIHPSTPPPTVSLGTTPAPGPTTTRAPIFLGHNVVLDFFCVELSHEKCPQDTEMVCGSDNVSYDNFCEYEKARCTHRALKVKNFGPCV